MLKNLVVLLVSLTVALAVAEIVIPAIIPLRLVGPPVTRGDSVYGHALTPDLRATQTTPEFRIRISINTQGFRGPEQDESAGPPIVFIGDSFTFGFGVSDGDEYPQLVSRALSERFGHPHSGVVNAGVGNHGQGRWVKFLRRDAPRLAPRAIVLQMHQNDFRDNGAQHLFELSEAGDLIEPPVRRMETGRRLQQWTERIPFVSRTHLFALVRQSYHAIQMRKSPAEDAEQGEAARADRLTVMLIEESLHICAEQGWPVVALLAALDPHQLELVLPVLERWNVPVSLFPAKSDRQDLHWTLDGHWNEAGHRFAAERVLDLLERAGVIPADSGKPSSGGPAAPRSATGAATARS
ncbi:MAG TPA: SGNH/GDSL hydrolase family protein [Longimicrobiales bacterium]|nr:SGNH/GDSL hydrolase family protein [Longimicrobiales bacterium]